VRWFEADCKVTQYPVVESHGGQHVGTGPSGVQVEHIPTKTIAAISVHRSQHKNRVAAMDMIEIALEQPK
jgi:protein subunit release factor A